MIRDIQIVWEGYNNMMVQYGEELKL